MIVTCDRCGGAGCLKCGYHGSIVVAEKRKMNGYRIAACILWYGFLGILVGGLAGWVLTGPK